MTPRFGALPWRPVLIAMIVWFTLHCVWAQRARSETTTICGGRDTVFGEQAPIIEETSLAGHENMVIEQVVVDLGLFHTWTGDLTVTLSHGGADVRLLNRPGYPASPFGCGGRNVAVTFRDDAATNAHDVCDTLPPGIIGELRPFAPLAGFVGMPPGGPWTLSIADVGADDCGMLPAGGVCLSITHAPDCNHNGVPDAGDIDSGTSTDDNANAVPDECDLPADTDGDDDVDLSDIARWRGCETGPTGSIAGGLCHLLDVDGDGDADLVDWAAIQSLFTS